MTLKNADSHSGLALLIACVEKGIKRVIRDGNRSGELVREDKHQITRVDI